VGPFLPTPATRGASSASFMGRRAAWEAERIESLAKAFATPTQLGALGTVLLIDGRVDDAIVTLGLAARAGGGATAWSDLAAAHLARYGNGHTLGDAGRALAAAERALAVDSDLCEALFNRALALDALYLQDEAARAWLDYFQSERDVLWERAARARIHSRPTAPDDLDPTPDAMLARPAEEQLLELRRWPQRWREYIEDELLTQWGAAVVASNREGSARLLAQSRQLAGVLADVTGDRLLEEATIGLAAISLAERRRLAAGLVEYRLARTAQGVRDYRTAERHFALALALLEHPRVPLFHWADFNLTNVRHFLGDATAERFARLAAIGEARSYLALAARASALQGLALPLPQEFSRSTRAYERAHQLFRQLNEQENVAFVSFLLSENYDLLGDYQNGWRHRTDALSLLATVGNPERRQAILLSSAYASAQQQLPEVAEHFQTAAVAAAVESGRPALIAEAHLHRARIRLRLRDRAGAQTDLGEADRRLHEGVPDPVSTRLRAELAFVRSEWFLPVDPAKSVESSESLLTHFERRGEGYRLPRLRLLRARAKLAQGDLAGAEEELGGGAAVVQRQQRALHDPAVRLEFVSDTWNLYTAWAELAARDGKAGRALEVLEAGRARTLGESPETSSVSAALAQSAPGWFGVVYLVSDHDLLIWVVGQGGIRHVRVAVSRAQLEVLAWQFLAELMLRQDAGSERAAHRLYEVLLRPVESLVPDGATLVVVADGVLHSVPFSALIDQSGRYAIERWPLAMAPALLPRITPAASAPTGSRALSALVVAEPAHDRRRWPELPALPAAALEGRAIAQMYRPSRLIQGTEATPTLLCQAAPAFDVVHFAGHSVSHGVSAEPVLVLAPDAHGNDVLGATQLRGCSWRGPKLVVLAACRTASGRIVATEGALSLALPLLASGVPAVVATLWDTEDDSSRAVMERFHQDYRRTRDPLAALRNAQLATLRDPNASRARPRTWAAFVAMVPAAFGQH